MKNLNICKTAVAAFAIGCAMTFTAPAQEVSTELFSVTVPDEIAAICDIQTDAGTIAFYETISSDSFGGFVGDIQLYRSVTAYGYLPNYRRGGQVNLSDGTKLDVVIALPSDVQFDVENQESIDNYHLISDALIDEILPTLVPTDGEYIPQEEVDTTLVYAEVLDKLRAHVEAGADAETLTGDDFSGLYSYLAGEENPLAAIGYLYMDINYDGYDELAVGRVGDNAIYDLFTQQDGKVIHVFSGGERDIFTLVGSEYGYNTIKETASGGASLTNFIFYNLDPVKAELSQQLTYNYNEMDHPDAP